MFTFLFLGKKIFQLNNTKFKISDYLDTEKEKGKQNLD
jgi:hypothetical protein